MPQAMTLGTAATAVAEQERTRALTELEQEHRALNQRTDEFARRPWLRPGEAVELARLKKEKLRLKDAMHALVSPTNGV